LRGETIHARRASMWEKSWRAVRRRPALASAACFAVIACVAMSAAWIVAEENQALLGLRTVTITTEPAGAEVVFVPLQRITGEPIAARRTLAAGVSPVEVQLKPGNYLVVARLADGRFHEVYRYVPEVHQTLPGGSKHQFWRIGAEGEVQLPTIDIPPATVSRGMALIDGDDQIAAFYIDPTEFTVAQYRDLVAKGGLPKDVRDELAADSDAIWMNYDRALAAAEKVGKRLPSEAEYEYAATRGGKSEFPWGAWNRKIESQGAAIERFGEVGSPRFDRLDVEPPVYGLCSNVAEWTTSWPARGAEYEGSTKDEYMSPNHHRIVRGGDLSVVDGGWSVTRSNRDPKQRNIVPRLHIHRGLGFRCVRSTTPRFFDSR
jgi:hypothetical protein